MPSSSFIYNSAKAGLNMGGASGLCYWSSVTASFYATLVTASYAIAESHVYASALSGSEVSTAGFTAGFNGSIRVSLTLRVLNINHVSNQAEFQAGTLNWSGLNSATAAALVILQQAGSDGTSPLVGINVSGGFPVVMNGTNFVISFGSGGVFDAIDV